MQDALNNAMALQNAGKANEARSAYRAILDEEPDNFDALRFLGLLTVTGGEARGIELIEKAVRRYPDRVLAQLQLGSAYHHLKRWPEALRCFARVVEQHPKHAGAHFSCGAVLLELGKNREARRALTRSIQLDPKHAEAHFALAKLYRLEGRHGAAAKRLETFVRLQPEDVRGYSELADCLIDAKRAEDASAVLRKGLETLPDDTRLLNLLGRAHATAGRFEEAAEAYENSLRVDPDQPHTYSNYGGVLECMPGRLADAEACHRKAVEMQPDLWNAYSNLGNFLRTVHRLDEAESVLRDALGKDPDNFELHTTLGLVLLSAGKLRDGFHEYGYRWQKPVKTSTLEAYRLADRPMWDGSPIDGNTILVWPEQGNGDYLQFLRYIPLLAERGARVILGARKGLESLARTVPGVSDVVGFEGPVDPRMPFDCHCPIVNLPDCFNTDIDSIPGRIPYVFPRPERISAWQRSFAAIRKPRIGIVWAGRPQHTFDRQRSLALGLLKPALDHSGVQFYSLQVGVNSPDVKQLPDGRVIDLSKHLTNYEETAAAITNMDLVVSVDTSVAHVAGALDKPVWMLLSSAPSLMWLRDRDDSPWYPSMRIFRQGDDEDWEPVIERLREALRERYS